jgi:hypothetical protein
MATQRRGTPMRHQRGLDKPYILAALAPRRMTVVVHAAARLCLCADGAAQCGGSTGEQP